MEVGKEREERENKRFHGRHVVRVDWILCFARVMNSRLWVYNDGVLGEWDVGILP